MKKLILMLCILLILCNTIVACNTDDHTDNEYELVIKGITTQDVIVTKGQIKQLQTTSLDHLTALDKFVEGTTDKIVYTARGVWLDDIIKTYVDSNFVYSDYGRVDVESIDSYSITISPLYFLFDVKPLIALEYNGKVLSQEGSSGALRLVVDGSEQAVWAKKIKTITFYNGVSNNIINNIVILGTQPISNGFVKISDIMGDATIPSTFVSCMTALDLSASGVGVVEFVGYRTNATSNLTNGKIYMSIDKSPVYMSDNMQIGETVSNLFSFELPQTLVVNQDKLAEYLQLKSLKLQQYLASYNMWADMKITYVENSQQTTSPNIPVNASTAISFEVKDKGLNITINGVTYKDVCNIIQN